MAITPEHALATSPVAQLTPDESTMAGEIEEQVDGHLSVHWNGTGTSVELPFVPSIRVLAEVVRRYSRAGWRVTFDAVAGTTRGLRGETITSGVRFQFLPIWKRPIDVARGPMAQSEIDTRAFLAVTRGVAEQLVAFFAGVPYLDENAGKLHVPLDALLVHLRPLQVILSQCGGCFHAGHEGACPCGCTPARWDPPAAAPLALVAGTAPTPAPVDCAHGREFGTCDRAACDAADRCLNREPATPPALALVPEVQS